MGKDTQTSLGGGGKEEAGEEEERGGGRKRKEEADEEEEKASLSRLLRSLAQGHFHPCLEQTGRDRF